LRHQRPASAASSRPLIQRLPSGIGARRLAKGGPARATGTTSPPRQSHRKRRDPKITQRDKRSAANRASCSACQRRQRERFASPYRLPHALRAKRWLPKSSLERDFWRRRPTHQIRLWRRCPWAETGKSPRSFARNGRKSGCSACGLDGVSFRRLGGGHDRGATSELYQILTGRCGQNVLFER